MGTRLTLYLHLVHCWNISEMLEMQNFGSCLLDTSTMLVSTKRRVVQADKVLCETVLWVHRVLGPQCGTNVHVLRRCCVCVDITWRRDMGDLWVPQIRRGMVLVLRPLWVPQIRRGMVWVRGDLGYHSRGGVGSKNIVILGHTWIHAVEPHRKWGVELICICNSVIGQSLIVAGSRNHSLLNGVTALVD